MRPACGRELAFSRLKYASHKECLSLHLHCCSSFVFPSRSWDFCYCAGTARLSLWAQSLALPAMGISASFLVFVIVQLPERRSWLATLLVLMVFVASHFAVRTFLRSLAEEENEKRDELGNHEP